MNKEWKWGKLKEQYPGGVPEDVKAAYVAEQKKLHEEMNAAWWAKQNGGHEGKILYFGSLVLLGLCGLWTLAGIMVFMGLMYLVSIMFPRFPLATILLGFAGFIYVMTLVLL